MIIEEGNPIICWLIKESFLENFQPIASIVLTSKSTEYANFDFYEKFSHVTLIQTCFRLPASDRPEIKSAWKLFEIFVSKFV